MVKSCWTSIKVTLNGELGFFAELGAQVNSLNPLHPSQFLVLYILIAN